MPKLIYKGTLPTTEEFKRDIADAIMNANPLDDLLELANDLHQYELQYGLTSEEFYQGYQAGMLNDELQHCMRWASIYRMFVKTKRQLENALMRTAIRVDDVAAELEKVAP
jgi:hypothetical protein